MTHHSEISSESDSNHYGLCIRPSPSATWYGYLLKSCPVCLIACKPASTLECERRCVEYPASTWGLAFGQDGAVSV